LITSPHRSIFAGIDADGEKAIFDSVVYRRKSQTLARTCPTFPDLDDPRAYIDEEGYEVHVNKSRLLFLPDFYETYYSQRDAIDDNMIIERLKSMKGLLLEEYYPDELVLGIEEYGGSLLHVYDYGKGWLVWLVGALPDVGRGLA